MPRDYHQLIERIAYASGLSAEEIDRQVEAKCAKLSGLISKEGSAQIVASELGVSFETEKLKISELSSGMKKVRLVGKIIKINPINEFTTKNGNSGKVLSMSVGDETGNLRVVLWDTRHIDLFETEKIKEGDVVEISGANMRNEEIHLSGFSDIRLSKEVIENVITKKYVHEKKISEIRAGENVKIRANIVQIFEPRFFEICPECNTKAVDSRCNVHGVIVPLKRALLGVVLDDGTDNIRGILFSEQISKFGLDNEELANPERFMRKKEELLGNENFFECSARNNNFFNTTELIINDIEEINLDELIETLKR